MKYCFIIFWSSWMLKIDSVLSGHESTANFHNLLLSGPVCWSQCQKVIMTLVQTRNMKINVQGQNSLVLHNVVFFPWALDGWNYLSVNFFEDVMNICRIYNHIPQVVMMKGCVITIQHFTSILILSKCF